MEKFKDWDIYIEEYGKKTNRFFAQHNRGNFNAIDWSLGNKNDQSHYKKVFRQKGL